MKKSLHLLSTSVIVLAIAGCAPADKKVNDHSIEKDTVEQLTWLQQVEKAHAKSDFEAFDSVEFDIELYFGGTLRLDAHMTLATNSSWGKIDYSDGRFVHFDGDKVVHSADIDSTSARFTAYTWSYFFMYPFKLSDPGTQWRDYPDKVLNGETFEVEKLSFEAGTGDAPEDWYISYVDPETRLTEVAAYIVTAGGTVEEAEEDPHAIRYHDYESKSGVPIATNWTFWAWTKDGGLTEQLGQASLKNIELR